MARPEDIRGILENALDREEARREAAISGSRALVRDCRRAISSMVQSEGPCDESFLMEAARPILEMAREPSFQEHGILEEPMTELAEAFVLSRTICGADIPLPSEVGLSERAYAMGVCDALGEMRRIVLNRLLRGEQRKALEMFNSMKDIFGTVDGLIYPSGMIPLKRKQDVARGLLERTAGELAVSVSVRSHIPSIDEVGG